MAKSRRSSTRSDACHLEWRPSRLGGGILWWLAALAPWSVLASDLPREWAWPAALLAAGHAAVLAMGYGRRPAHSLAIPTAGGPPCRDGTPIDVLQVAWRGPLAFLRWREPDRRGWRRCVFWPDTLDATARRALRLALQHRDAAASTRSVAG